MRFAFRDSVYTMSSDPDSSSSQPNAPASQASAAAISNASAAPRTRSRLKSRTLVIACGLLLSATALVQGGCYYAHLAGGQWKLWSLRRPIEPMLGDPNVPEADRAILALLPALRRYATSIGLEADKQYHDFVDTAEDRVLTNVVATAPGSLEPHAFRFPLAGSFPYKGFFDPGLAEAEARHLRADGFDVCVSAVPAYSTLGWLADPITAPMLRYGPGVFAEMALHEWVHATVFVRGEGDFNEGVATFIGQEGVSRFFDRHAGPERGARERVRIDDERAISRVLADARGRVETLYAVARARGDEASIDSLRQQIAAETRGRLAALPLQTRDPVRVAEKARLGDACLALTATYEGDLEAYRARLEALGGDLSRFVAETRHAAQQEDPRAALRGL